MGRSLVPPKNDKAKDLVWTPRPLAQAIVEYFEVDDDCLDPCLGDWNSFYDAMCEVGLLPEWCEISAGVDFYDYHKSVTWICTNPPYSDLLRFMRHCFRVADNVVLLIQPPSVWFTAKRDLALKYKMGLREIRYYDIPKHWTSFGTGIAAVYWQRNYEGDVKVTDARMFDKCPW